MPRALGVCWRGAPQPKPAGPNGSGRGAWAGAGQAEGVKACGPRWADEKASCSIPKIQILEFSQTRSKFKMNLKFHFKIFVCELISTNKV
jgi:hypothetical protein